MCYILCVTQYVKKIFAEKEKAGQKTSFFNRLELFGNYFLGAIASFAALATRNFTTVFALI